MQEKILMSGPRKHSSYPLNFFFCIRSPAGVNVDIPLQNFITSFQVVDVYTQCVLNNPGGVLKFAVQTTKYLYFILTPPTPYGVGFPESVPLYAIYPRQKAICYHLRMTRLAQHKPESHRLPPERQFYEVVI